MTHRQLHRLWGYRMRIGRVVRRAHTRTACPASGNRFLTTLGRCAYIWESSHLTRYSPRPSTWRDAPRLSRAPATPALGHELDFAAHYDDVGSLARMTAAAGVGLCIGNGDQIRYSALTQGCLRRLLNAVSSRRRGDHVEDADFGHSARLFATLSSSIKSPWPVSAESLPSETGIPNADICTSSVRPTGTHSNSDTRSVTRPLSFASLTSFD